MPSSLSFCTIVKNEEKFLSGMLESISNISDEIIIVDTGSTDNTVEIAKKFNTKIFYYQWNDSFSDARNFAISKATKDWIFNIDADERLIYPERLKKYLVDDKDLVYFIKIQNQSDKGSDISPYYNSNTRLFPNNSGYKYFCSVHEQVLRLSNTPFQRKFINDCFLLHLGYDQTTEVMQNKRERNIKLIKKDLEKNEIALNYYLYFLLAREYLTDNDYQNGIKYLKKVLEEPFGEDSVTINSVTMLIKIYFHLKQWNKLQDLFKNYSSYGIKNPDFVIYYGLYLQEIENRANDALLYYYKCLNFKPEELSITIYNGASVTWKPLLLIGEIYFEKNNFSRAINYFEKALSFNESKEIILKLAEAYNINNQIEKLDNLKEKYNKYFN